MRWQEGRGRRGQGGNKGRGKQRPYILVLAGLVFCAGCAPHPAAPPAALRDPNLNLTLEMLPRPVTSLDPTDLTVRVTDGAGKPVSGATLALHLDMPAMPMGDNAVATREAASGTYVGTGRFTMAGAWRVTASAIKGPERAVRVFPVEVR